MTRLKLAEARRAMIAAQGFAPAAAEDPFDRTGFVRTLGGTDVYLAVRARAPRLRRADVDAAVQTGHAQVIPAVRGCMYLVPRRHVAVALRLAEQLSRSRAEREQARAGIAPGEVEKLAERVADSLRASAGLTTDALRRVLPAGSVRSLGEAGRKVGISSPLPAALRLLEFAGRLERVPEGGRLDTERYLWRRPKRSPFTGADVPAEPAELVARVAEVFFRSAGLGSVRELAEWLGVPQREATAAAARLELQPVEIEGVADPHFALQDEVDRVLAAEGAQEALAFLPFEDNLLALHGGAALLVDEQHHHLEVRNWGSQAKPTTLGAARHMMLRPLVAEGRVAGVWEYQPDEREVVFAELGALPAKARRRVEAAARDVAAFLAGDVGHGRSFSLDTDEELRARAQAVRSLGARS